VRRHPVRHGHAHAEQCLRAHLGGSCGSETGRRLLDDGHPAIKARFREFRFLAEAYWTRVGTAAAGFDSCYDKKLYDRMEHGDAENVRQHLLADSSYQRNVRFIENHDEPRAAATFPSGKGRAAAVAILTLTGRSCCTRAVRGQEGEAARLPGPSPGRAVDRISRPSTGVC